MYLRFGELKMDYRSPAGYDRTRNTVIGHKDFDLTYLEESFTSEHWLVRVYRLAQSPEIIPSFIFLYSELRSQMSSIGQELNQKTD